MLENASGGPVRPCKEHTLNYKGSIKGAASVVDDSLIL